MKFIHMLQLLTLALFTSIAQANVKSVEPHTVLKLIEAQQAPLILDVRTAKEFAHGHIPGAVNISYDLLMASQALDEYKDSPIIIYCRTGRRAQVAAQILQKKGFTQLSDINGSMIAWQQLQYPIAMF